MSIDGLQDDDIRRILSETNRIAVVGASNKTDRASYYVPEFLAAHGYQIAAVNPGLAGQTLHGATVLASLAEVGALDMVNIFRASEQAGAVIDEAIRLGAKTVWLPLGVIDEDAARRAREAGLVAVMDRCPKIEWRRLGLPA